MYIQEYYNKYKVLLIKKIVQLKLKKHFDFNF